MGAIIEIDMFLVKGPFYLKEIKDILYEEEIVINVKNVSSFESWNFDGKRSIDSEDLYGEIEDNFRNKIIYTDFIVNNQYKCNLIISDVDNGYINFSFGLDTDSIFQSKDGDFDQYVNIIYDKATEIIISFISRKAIKKQFLAASMGIEYSVEFNENTVDMLNDDNGVARWILPKGNIEYNKLLSFSPKFENDFIIFERSRGAWPHG